MVPAGEAILSGAGSDIRILSHIPKRSEIYSHPLVYGCQKKTPHGQWFRASFGTVSLLVSPKPTQSSKVPREHIPHQRRSCWLRNTPKTPPPMHHEIPILKYIKLIVSFFGWGIPLQVEHNCQREENTDKIAISCGEYWFGFW